MGEAVAKRTILRTKENGELETWGDVARRVSLGNALLINLLQDKDADWISKHIEEERLLLEKHIASGTLLMSGRHLQHGDATQPSRNMEVYTNCSTATTSFMLFYLLLNGSGVGRAYDDDMCVVDWDFMPSIRVVFDESHKDFEWGKDESVKEAEQKYPNAIWHKVHDSREGWAKVIEIIEMAAYLKKHVNDIFVFDFTDVRPLGAPIKGMQNRPSSGPKPLMQAIKNLASIKGARLSPWKQAMWIDHYLAESVLVGGARRSARMSTKFWKDPEVFDFINIKRRGSLWSSNNSITVDSEFWEQKTDHAKNVLETALKASYYDKTGEPGFINQDRLHENREGVENYKDYVGSFKYKVDPATNEYLNDMKKIVFKKKYMQITNPCGEISLNALGGYCVIADVVPYHAKNKEEAIEAFRVATRALIRVNLMDSLYKKEVERTNRIGVGMTGVHEYAWAKFVFGFKDLIDEEKSQSFWVIIKEFSQVVKDEAKRYSKLLGLVTPHTDTTIKPAGTTSKLFGLTEGVHLPSMKEYVRWVQFRDDDPLVERYRSLGYPIKKLNSYHGSTAIGFPTQPEICKLGMGPRLVTAGEATPEEQYKWLMLLEKYWLGKTGNQISYTLKYKPDIVLYETYKEMITKWQSQVRCCSVMPQVDATIYEYQPEESVTLDQFIEIASKIKDTGFIEDIDLEQLKCQTGACPI